MVPDWVWLTRVARPSIVTRRFEYVGWLSTWAGAELVSAATAGAAVTGTNARPLTATVSVVSAVTARRRREPRGPFGRIATDPDKVFSSRWVTINVHLYGSHAPRRRVLGKP